MKDYKEVTFPKTRIATFDIFETGLKQHHVKGLLELDVTEARSLIKAYRSSTKNALSFTAWLIKTISKTIEEFQSAHAYLKGKENLFYLKISIYPLPLKGNMKDNWFPYPMSFVKPIKKVWLK